MKAKIKTITKGGDPIKDQAGVIIGKIPPGIHLDIELIDPATLEKHPIGISFFHPSEASLNELKLRLKMLSESIKQQKAVENKVNTEGLQALMGQEIDLGD